MRLVDHGAELSCRIERIADADCPRDLHNFFQQRLAHWALDQQPTTGAADLALVVEDAPGSLLRGLVEIAHICHHDVG